MTGVLAQQRLYCKSSKLSLFDDADKVAALTAAIDEINGFYGAHTVHSADTLGLANRMKRKIPFGVEPPAFLLHQLPEVVIAHHCYYIVS